MGANAQTAVPKFTAGQVLTAAQQTQINTGVPVFATTTTRDAAFGGSNKTLAQGQMCYIEADGKVYVYSGSAWASISSVKNVAAFTASGTWTVPTGVTYAVANIRAGGGGIGTASAGAGGTSSVAFAGGTISATGGNACNSTLGAVNASTAVAGAANSGQGAGGSISRVSDMTQVWRGGDGAYIVAGGAVTAGASITVTVGAGGTAGTTGAAGGSGYVWIEYEV
jgi:collagen type I/II/III/V/XI/XXIV/XXVII alpha